MQRDHKYLSTPVKLTEEEIDNFEKKAHQAKMTPVLVVESSIHQDIGAGPSHFKRMSVPVSVSNPVVVEVSRRPISAMPDFYGNVPVTQPGLPHNYHSQSHATIQPDLQSNSHKDPVVIRQNHLETEVEEPMRILRPSTWKRKHNLLFASLLSVVLVVGAALALFIVLLKSKGKFKEFLRILHTISNDVYDTKEFLIQFLQD